MSVDIVGRIGRRWSFSKFVVSLDWMQALNHQEEDIWLLVQLCMSCILYQIRRRASDMTSLHHLPYHHVAPSLLLQVLNSTFECDCAHRICRQSVPPCTCLPKRCNGRRIERVPGKRSFDLLVFYISCFWSTCRCGPARQTFTSGLLASALKPLFIFKKPSS